MYHLIRYSNDKGKFISIFREDYKCMDYIRGNVIYENNTKGILSSKIDHELYIYPEYSSIKFIEKSEDLEELLQKYYLEIL